MSLGQTQARIKQHPRIRKCPQADSGLARPRPAKDGSRDPARQASARGRRRGSKVNPGCLLPKSKTGVRKTPAGPSRAPLETGRGSAARIHTRSGSKQTHCCGYGSHAGLAVAAASRVLGRATLADQARLGPPQTPCPRHSRGTMARGTKWRAQFMSDDHIERVGAPPPPGLLPTATFRR